MAKQQRHYGTERISALTDGVIAIAITLLVLDLRIPHLAPGYSEHVFIDNIAEQSPRFVSYLISFILLARFWHVHHVAIARLRYCNTTTIIINLVFLALCALVPFGSSLLGTYEFDPVAVILFSVILGASGLVAGLLAYHVATSPQLLSDPEASVRSWDWKYHSYGVPGAAVLASVLVLIDAWLAILVWLVEPLAAFISNYRSRQHSPLAAADGLGTTD